MNTLSNFLHSIGPVIACIHCGNVRQQRLSSADIAGRLLTPYMLFASLQRKSQSGPTTRVLRASDNTARHLAFECVARCEVGGMWPSISERHTKTLRSAQGDVTSEFSWRTQ